MTGSQQRPHPEVQRYLDATLLAQQLPAQHSSSQITVTTVSGRCKKCEKQLHEQRGHVKELFNCLEIESAGVCHHCKLVTWSKVRFYEHHLLAKTDAGWKEYAFKRENRLFSSIFKLLTKLK